MKFGLKISSLAFAIALFVVLDLGTLAFSYKISKQVESDAIAINLAGRQRMLSQRTSKAILVAAMPDKLPGRQKEAVAEAARAYGLFVSTLQAFAQGGRAIGGNGEPVMLEPVRDRAVPLVARVQGLIAEWPEVPAAEQDIERFARFMIEHNLEILDAMNQLTSELEHQSIAAVFKLRVAQTAAFSLSLINFFGILWGMYREKQRAERNAVSDSLTGLLNRAGIYHKLDSELAAARERDAAVAVMLLDLDGFKAVNDNYGHAAGDEALVEIGRRIAGWCQPGWSGGRIGGDEFVIICPNVPAHSLESLVLDLEKTLSGTPGGGLVISASVGCAISRGDMTADDLVSAADAMMYSRKVERKKSTHFRSSPRDA